MRRRASDGVHRGVHAQYEISCVQGGIEYDIDWTSFREGKTPAPPAGNPTYAAVTARSYHPGTVNVVLMDGSTRLREQLGPSAGLACGGDAGGRGERRGEPVVDARPGSR